MAHDGDNPRISIVGTGFIAEQACGLLDHPDLPFEVTKVLTRRPTDDITFTDTGRVTNSVEEAIEGCDVVLEVSGDAAHAATVVEAAFDAGKPVVTMNSEFHVTCGSAFVGRGSLTEAEGDQPGCLALLHREATSMGFRILAYVNIKGFLNPDPTPEEMVYWSERQNLALHQTVQFTDGTKTQIEQVLVANGLGAELVCEGLDGERVERIEQSDRLAEIGLERGVPVSDFVVCGDAPPGVFVLADHEVADRVPGYGPYARLKTESGRFFVLVRPYHLCALEVPKALASAARGEAPLLHNSDAPRYGVAAVAKHAMPSGHAVPRALGSFDFRGHAVGIAEHPNHVPLCVLEHATLTNAVEPGQVVTFDDVDLPPSRALELYLTIRDGAVQGTRLAAPVPQ